jgi:uncharacterized membrane protein YphA (DoxX/SURF4 family)
MKTNRSPQSRCGLDTAALATRWLLGALFLYLGLTKAMHPIEFLKVVRQYEMVGSYFLLNSIAATLPWFEVFCGLLLLSGVAVRGAALMLVLMLVPFSFVVLKHAWAIQTVQGIALCAVKFDCGCGTGEVLICRKLAENCALLFLSSWLLAGRGRRLCARYSLVKPESPAPPAPL